MTNPQAPTTVAEAQLQMTEALNNLNAAFSTFIEHVITDPEIIFSAGDFVSELSSGAPAIIGDIVQISICGADLA